MRPRFRDDKTTEMACRFLHMRGGTMSYMKLLKLMYLVDREALLRWGRPVTFDRHVSMDQGPVLSRTLDLMREEPEPGHESVWHRFIGRPDANYDISLREGECNPDHLSDAELDLIGEVFAEHGTKSRWAIRDFTHTLPEWQNPAGTMIPIAVRDILIRNGKTELETAAIEEELESLAFAEQVFA